MKNNKIKIIINESQFRTLINYGIENFSFLLKENKNDSTKADYVSDDVQKFFNILSSIKEPLIQQKRGSMSYQKNVEAFQIALTLLGYPLTKHGIDGYFGSETARAFEKFAKENDIKLGGQITEDVSEFKPSGGITVARGVDTSIDTNLQKLITDIQSEFGKPIKITSGYRDPERNRRIGGAKRSAHLRHNAVDITFNRDKEDTLRFIEIASSLGAGGIGVYRPGVIHIDLEGRRSWGPSFSSSSIPKWSLETIKKHLSGEFSSGGKVTPTGEYSTEIGTIESPSSPNSQSDILKITPDIISKMIDLLKQKNIKSEDLSRLVNNVISNDVVSEKGKEFAKGLIVSKNNDSNNFMVVFGGTPSAKYGAKFMRSKFGNSRSVNFVFSDWENTIDGVLSKLKEEYPNAKINAVVGFSKGGLRAWPAVGKYDFVGLIDPSIEGNYKSVSSVPKSANVVLTYIPNRGWGMDGLNYAINKLGQDRSIPVTGINHSETPRDFFNRFIG